MIEMVNDLKWLFKIKFGESSKAEQESNNYDSMVYLYFNFKFFSCKKTRISIY